MRILVGVSGGIAAYKACELVSRLVQSGHEVRVVLTPGATEFVRPLTFRALSGHAVGVVTSDEPEGPLSHITLAHWADAMVIAPASTSLLARLASGQATDMLSLIYLGFVGPVLVAPAMEPDMWGHPRAQANVRTLTRDGVRFVGPHQGRLASGRTGLGRMAEPAEIVESVLDLTEVQDLQGIRVVVTAGSTWEYFDPVRLLTNPSTGLMGVLIANLAARRGAQVTIIPGPAVTFPLHMAVTEHRVESAEEMLQAVQAAMPDADVFIGAAAVSDFRPRHRLSQKAPKESIGLEWSMEPNPDIIRVIAEQYRHQKKLLVGFAAETENPEERARYKRENKGLDAVVANLVGSGQGFGHGIHRAWLVTKTGSQPISVDSKTETAKILLDWVQKQVREGSGWNR